MSHFRTKPVVIEAFQWDGTIASYDAINRWAGREQMRPKEEGVWRDRVEQGVGEEYFTALIVHALGGDVRAYTGDWIIRGVIGELYPCKPDIFAATYESANGASSSERRDEVTDVDAARAFEFCGRLLGPNWYARLRQIVEESVNRTATTGRDAKAGGEC